MLHGARAATQGAVEHPNPNPNPNPNPLALKEQRAGYRAELAEALVPLLQGVLRTYRHFLALEAAPPAAEVDTHTQYGQLTVLALVRVRG